jgi:hypothetical protein
MKDTLVTEQVARDFLLGEIDPEQRQRIESLFLTDPETRETILIVEDSLLEEYLEGTLASSEARKFLQRYATNPKERQKIRITQSIKRYAIENAAPISTPTSAIEKLRLALAGWTVNPRRNLVVASIAIVLVIIGGWLMFRINERLRENSQKASIERQLAEVNSPGSLSTSPPKMFSTTLSPISVRSVQSSAAMILQPSAGLVELHLFWPQKDEYPFYRAELSRVEGTKMFTLPPLHLEKDEGVRVVRMRIPADLLPAGLYQIRLSGIASDNAPGPAEEYDFRIAHQ